MTQQNTNSAALPYLGSKISLVSNSEIRYEGTLYNINPEESTVALQNVRSFGTEGRKYPDIPLTYEVYDFIIFRGKDIKDLTVCSEPETSKVVSIPNNDPAIISMTIPPNPTSNIIQQQNGGNNNTSQLRNNNTVVVTNNNVVSQQQNNTSSQQLLAPSHHHHHGVGNNMINHHRRGGGVSSIQQQQHNGGIRGGNMMISHQGNNYNNTTNYHHQHHQVVNMGGNNNSGRGIHMLGYSNYGSRGLVGGNTNNNMRLSGSRGLPGVSKFYGNITGGRGADGNQRNHHPRLIVGELPSQPNMKLKAELNKEFDFETSNQKFDKPGADGKAPEFPAEGSSSTPTPMGGYIQESFFDNISCETLDRQQGREETFDRDKQRALDLDTFGQSAANYRPITNGRRGGRGRGMRGGSGYRGSYRGSYRGRFQQQHNNTSNNNITLPSHQSGF